MASRLLSHSAPQVSLGLAGHGRANIAPNEDKNIAGKVNEQNLLIQAVEEIVSQRA
jgi:hypothetical protein